MKGISKIKEIEDKNFKRDSICVEKKSDQRIGECWRPEKNSSLWTYTSKAPGVFERLV